MTMSEPTIDQPATRGPVGIRPIQTHDRAAALAVVGSVGLFADAELVGVAQLLDAFLAGAADENDRWITDATVDGSNGVAYYAPERMADGTWNLFLLAVSTAVQGTGRGAALVEYVEADLQAMGARLLLIETSGVEGFTRQRRFYAGLGYRREATIRDFYAAGDDKVIFWKSMT